MARGNDLIQDRQRKAEFLERHKINIFPESGVENRFLIGDILSSFGGFLKSKKKVLVAGRLFSLRFHGGIVFADLKDESGKIQLVFNKEKLGKTFEYLENLDIGDFISAQGLAFETKRKEKSINIERFEFLAKSFRPLPSLWYGLEDTEERFRKRYVDLVLNSEVSQRLKLRSLIIKKLKNILDENGFIEVETPIFQIQAGGASAKPFKTHLDILDLDLYLRIAPELYLKRLMVGGFEKIYELGKVFRNEGISKEHNPEFTMLELYWAYTNADMLMDFVEDVFIKLVKSLPDAKNGQITYSGKKISFKKPFKKVEFLKLIKQATGLDYFKASQEDFLNAAQKSGVECSHKLSKGKLADEIYKKIIRPTMTEPTFVIGHPRDISPLAKSDEKNPEITKRFNLIVGGFELVNGFSELNDPREQKTRFEEQETMRKQGDEEVERMDKDFIEALEYGMPPAAGLGLGVDRLVALLTDAPNIKEIISFPLLKPRNE